jgi:hypothetical protein
VLVRQCTELNGHWLYTAESSFNVATVYSRMKRYLNWLLGCIGAALLVPSLAADLYNGTPSPIREPICIDDPSSSFVADAEAPEDQFALVVRHMDADALSANANYDFGAIDGMPLTGFHADDPRGFWQRAKEDLDANYTSAFQLHCADAGFFINAWRFAPQDLIDEGPHAAYAYTFSAWPRVFDGDPNTDLVFQVSLEVPWLYRPAGEAVAQTFFQARFFDVGSGKLLQMTLLIYSSQDVSYPAYADYARNDSLFVSAPLATTKIATLSPYSSPATTETWTGLRFFRAQITPANFAAAIDLANRFCATRADIPDCGIAPGHDTALSPDPADYLVTEFSVITELFNADTDLNGMSIGLHLKGLGAYNFR